MKIYVVLEKRKNGYPNYDLYLEDGTRLENALFPEVKCNLSSIGIQEHLNNVEFAIKEDFVITQEKFEEMIRKRKLE